MKMLNDIEAVCAQIKNDLKDEDTFLNQVKDNEDKIIFQCSRTINVGLPFIDEVPEAKREVLENERVSYYAFFINELITELLSNCSSPHFPNRESAAEKWVIDGETAPFYARVWKDYKPQNDSEIEIFKKETVKVTKTGFTDYWLVQKTNNETGYVPCTQLEPVA